MFTSADCAPRLSRFPSSPTAFPHCAASGTNSNGHPEEPPVSQDHGVVCGVAAGRVGGDVRVHGLSGPRQLYSTGAPALIHSREDPRPSFAGGSLDGWAAALG